MIVIKQEDKKIEIPRGLVAPTGGGQGGSVVSWQQYENDGVKIAKITIDGTSTDVFAPSGTSIEDVQQAISDAMQVETARTEDTYAKKRNAYSSIMKMHNYLYATCYAGLDYGKADAYFKSKRVDINGGACSAVVAGNMVGRNYDWFDNYQAAVMVFSNAGRFANAGICTKADITTDLLESGAYSDSFDLLPFYMCDGKNEAGLFCEINVVPSKSAMPTVPTIEKRESICSIALVRYILDNFATADEAIDYIQKYVEIYDPETLGVECHYLIKDASKTYVIEFDNHNVIAIPSNKSTNFHIGGVTFNEDGSVYTNADVEDGNFPTSQGIEQYGQGLERWNIINAATIENKADMETLLAALHYSNTYTLESDMWYSEMVSGNVSLDTPANSPEMAERVALVKQMWAERSKDDPQVWITCHSVIYDGDMAYVKVQEGNEEFAFMLPKAGEGGVSKEYVDEQIAGVQEQIAGKQDTLVAGANITIEGNVISATGGGGEGIKDLSTMSQQELNALAEDIIAKWQQGEQFKDFYLIEGEPILGWMIQNEAIINPYVFSINEGNVKKLSYWLSKYEGEEDWHYSLWTAEDMPINKYIRFKLWENEGNISLVNIEGSSNTQEIFDGDTQATIQFVYSNLDLGLKNQGSAVVAKTGENAYKFYCEIFEGSNRYAVIMTADNYDFNNATITKTLITSGGGSSVSWHQIATGGTKIAEISIDGTTTDVFAPEGGSGGDCNYKIVDNLSAITEPTEGMRAFVKAQVHSGSIITPNDGVDEDFIGRVHHYNENEEEDWGADIYKTGSNYAWEWENNGSWRSSNISGDIWTQRKNPVTNDFEIYFENNIGHFTIEVYSDKATETQGELVNELDGNIFTYTGSKWIPTEIILAEGEEVPADFDFDMYQKYSKIYISYNGKKMSVISKAGSYILALSNDNGRDSIFAAYFAINDDRILSRNWEQYLQNELNNPITFKEAGFIGGDFYSCEFKCLDGMTDSGEANHRIVANMPNDRVFEIYPFHEGTSLRVYFIIQDVWADGFYEWDPEIKDFYLNVDDEEYFIRIEREYIEEEDTNKFTIISDKLEFRVEEGSALQQQQNDGYFEFTNLGQVHINKEVDKLQNDVRELIQWTREDIEEIADEGHVASTNIKNMVALTQAQYNALSEHPNDVFYVII